jgi:hypothetical protein
MRQHLKVVQFAAPHDFQDPTAQRWGPLNQRPGVAAIGSDKLQTREAPEQWGPGQFGAVPILNISRVIASSKPSVFTTKWRLRPFTFLPASYPRGPLFRSV